MENIFTVTQLTNKIKQIVEKNFSFVLLGGEISNCKKQMPSGHLYFTVKDENCQIRGVMWSSRVKDLLFEPENGSKVIIKGRVTLYPSRGEYQIEAWEIKPDGVGDLQLRYEMLKKKLFDEGLFDEQYKKEIPEFVENVALVTSKTGAVFHDFVKIIKRRFPVINIYLFQSLVQGNTAADECIQALKSIEKFNKTTKIDVIVIARGGGSFEDLFCFNNESLARAIFNCKIPVVSAIGHEVDYTICDFVADKRAPTPSAAAEMITPQINDIIEKLSDFSYFCKSSIEQKFKNLYSSVKEIESNYYFVRPKDLIYQNYQMLDDLSKIINNRTRDKINYYKEQLGHYSKTIYHIDPNNILKKGYALVYDHKLDLFKKDANRLIKRAVELKKDKKIEIKFYDGSKSAKVTN